MTSVAFFTIAYNAERYISKTIESVLNQTESNLVYYIRDNGSTDHTYEIIKSYAMKDSRILVFHNDVNGQFETQEPFHFPKPNSRYLTILDADDYIVEDYAEQMLTDADAHNADIVIAGTKFFEDEKEDIFFAERKLIDEVTTIDGNLNFGEIASTYGQLRVFWGKLYKTEFFYDHYLNWHQIDVGNIFNGFDTAVSLCLMISADKVVLSSYVGHRQRIRKNSRFFSSSPDYKRAFELINIYQLGLMMLKKYKADSTNNIKFIQSVARGHLLDLDSLLRKSGKSNLFKVEFILNIIVNERYKEIEEIMGYKAFITQFKLTLNELSNSLEELSVIDKSFVFSYLVAWNPNIPICVRKLLFLKSAYAHDNPNHFGFEEIYYWNSGDRIPVWFMKIGVLPLEEQKTLIADIQRLNHHIDSENNVDLKLYKNSILDLIDTGEVEDASRFCEYALEQNPIDRELLYLNCVISKRLNLNENFRLSKLLISLFYDHDCELLEAVNGL